MGIVQEKRFDAPSPKVEATDYGATFVTAGTETSVTAVPVADKEEEKPVEAVADATPEVVSAAPAVKARKKVGRPRKPGRRGGGA